MVRSSGSRHLQGDLLSRAKTSYIATPVELPSFEPLPARPSLAALESPLDRMFGFKTFTGVFALNA